MSWASALGRQLVGREPDSLDAALVDQQHERRVVDLRRHRLDRVGVPDRPHRREEPLTNAIRPFICGVRRN